MRPAERAVTISREMNESLSGVRYISQLIQRWGRKGPSQFYHMFKLHRTPFESILQNLFAVLDKQSANFAFPTIASIARMKPELIHAIVKEGHEVASHGFNHLRYPLLNKEERDVDLKLSLQVFRKMGVRVTGFRAPYDNYNDEMIQLLEKYRLTWDGGYGYRPEHRERTDFFKIDVAGRETDVTFIPLNEWSDDRMIDTLGMKPETITHILTEEIRRVAASKGVIMFDLHPIRIGQDTYLGCLNDMLEFSNSIGGWAPTPTEAIEYKKRHGKWKGDAEFCLLLTGDIDNWVFSDYLRRAILKGQSIASLSGGT